MQSCGTSALVACGREEPGRKTVDAHLDKGGGLIHIANAREFCFTMSVSGPTFSPPIIARVEGIR